MRTVRWTFPWVMLGVAPAVPAQPAGFDPALARDLSALCTTHTFRDLYGSDAAILPEGYERLHTSEPRGMDNLFQVFRKGAMGVIEVRGSTADPLSWMENVHAAMLPAIGTVVVDGRPFDYHFADDTAAAVHAGYTLGVAFIADEVEEQLRALDREGVHDIVLTGHSQGGALVQLLRAYLEHRPVDRVPARVRFRTYAFANPMVGNAAFVREYERAYCSSGTSFSIINPEDPVPGMPLAFHDHRIFSAATVNGMVSGQDGYDMRSLARSALFRMFRGTVTDLAQYISASVEKRIAKPVGEVRLPPYREEMNYTPMPGRVALEPFPYPLILRDSTILTNDSIMRANPRDAQGVFLNKDLYRRAPGFFQHKPYNYHVAILRRWFPERYSALRVKVLPENL
ncbi:MAG: hypothetical protein IT228_13795 [Flavobacteriales bacterium]|nr:hypothetical protein [Flavobacteriales bacterium]MCC6578408.1 hypothetical protein [Flavobacteriales bacterium]NUQ15917.1 hypothetical protein [Flavobacteriales bacterium]